MTFQQLFQGGGNQKKSDNSGQQSSERRPVGTEGGQMNFPMFEQDSYFPDNEPHFSDLPVTSGFVEAPQVGTIHSLPRRDNEKSPTSYLQQEYYNEDQTYPQYFQNPNEQYYPDPPQPPPPSHYQYHQENMPQYPIKEHADQGMFSAHKEPNRMVDDSFLLNLDDDRSNKKCMYLCIPVNKRRRNICLGITFIILLLLGIVIGVFYPRLPAMQVLSVDPVDKNSYELTNFDNANPNNFRFSMNMILNVSVINTNMYHLKVDKIDVATFVHANGTAINNENPSPATALFGISPTSRVYVTSSNFQSQIGTGSYGTIIFPPNKNVTFSIQLKINYSPGPLGALNDPTLNEMIQLCVQGDPNVDNGRRTTIAYTAVNSVGLLKYIGYNPTMQGSIKIRCPFQGAARTAFIAALGGKGSQGGTFAT